MEKCDYKSPQAEKRKAFYARVKEAVGKKLAKKAPGSMAERKAGFLARRGVPVKTRHKDA